MNIGAAEQQKWKMLICRLKLKDKLCPCEQLFLAVAATVSTICIRHNWRNHWGLTALVAA